jgi:hypothetical protein
MGTHNMATTARQLLKCVQYLSPASIFSDTYPSETIAAKLPEKSVAVSDFSQTGDFGSQTCNHYRFSTK